MNSTLLKPLFHVPTSKPRTTIYLAPELFQALERRAKEERRTMSNLCNLLIEDAMQVWLDANPPESKDPPAAKTSATQTKTTTATKATAKTKQSRASTRSK